MEIINILYLIFIFASLYVSFLFLILFFKNTKDMFKDVYSKKLPFLSILIPTYNEEESIKETINVIKKTTYPKNLMEIIVINDGSTDNTLNILKGFKNIKILNKKNSGKADSINQALKITKGQFVAVIDADSHPEPDAFLKMIPYFEDKEVAAVTSSVLVKNKTKLLEILQAIEYTLIAWARKLLEFIGSVYVTPGALSIYRKKALEKIGGFDTKNITEDIEITWNMLKNLYKTKICLSARTYTVVPNTIKKWWKQRLRWNIGGIQTMNKYKYVLFRKKYGMLGMFVAPFFLSFYLLSLLGFFVYIYLISRGFTYSWLSTKYASIANLSPLEILNFNFAPTVFTFFIVVLFLVSLFYANVALRTMSKRNKINLRYGLNLIIYVSLYLILYPVVLMHAVYRFLIGKVAW